MTIWEKRNQSLLCGRRCKSYFWKSLPSSYIRFWLWSCKISFSQKHWTHYIKLSFWTISWSSPLLWKWPRWWVLAKIGVGKILLDWAWPSWWTWWNPDGWWLRGWFCTSWWDFSKFDNFSSFLLLKLGSWFLLSCTDDCLLRLVDCLKDWLFYKVIGD